MNVKFIKKAVIGSDWYEVDDVATGKKELLQPYIDCSLAVEIVKEDVPDPKDNEETTDKGDKK